MAANLRRLERSGRMLAQAVTGTPGHVNAMAASVEVHGLLTRANADEAAEDRVFLSIGIDYGDLLMIGNDDFFSVGGGESAHIAFDPDDPTLVYATTINGTGIRLSRSSCQLRLANTTVTPTKVKTLTETSGTA